MRKQLRTARTERTMQDRVEVYDLNLNKRDLERYNRLTNYFVKNYSKKSIPIPEKNLDRLRKIYCRLYGASIQGTIPKSAKILDSLFYELNVFNRKPHFNELNIFNRK